MRHEGTWLTWPHSHTYGKTYAEEIEPIWIQMAATLSQDESVHIVAYDENLKQHIEDTLEKNNANMDQIDFVIAPSDDVWILDTGPIFVKYEKGQLAIMNFSFDGWGKKMPYTKDNLIPQAVSKQKNFPIIDASDLVMEGGSMEISADGTLMATKSSVVSNNRNASLTQTQVEDLLKKYLGVKRFIWLDGVLDEDITDAHIDGFARFLDKDTILTVPEDDFYDLFEGISEKDYDLLHSATNANGNPYRIIAIPLTKNNVRGLDYKGSYLNYYVDNQSVLLPVYEDPNDEVAVHIMKELFPEKTIVPIDVRALYKNGGNDSLCYTTTAVGLKSDDLFLKVLIFYRT